jgi:hypothetical protein
LLLNGKEKELLLRQKMCVSVSARYSITQK